MAVFPSTPAPSYSLEIGQQFRTIVSTFDSGREQRRAKWSFPKYRVTLRYKANEHAESETIWQFYQARLGSYEAFDFFHPLIQNLVGLYVCTGDGETTIFDVPGKTTSEHTIYNNASEVSADDYEILAGGGRSSSDRVQFDSPPLAGRVITADFRGYQRIRCRFAEDNFTRETFEVALCNYGVVLQGLFEELA